MEAARRRTARAAARSARRLARRACRRSHRRRATPAAPVGRLRAAAPAVGRRVRACRSPVLVVARGRSGQRLRGGDAGRLRYPSRRDLSFACASGRDAERISWSTTPRCTSSSSGSTSSTRKMPELTLQRRRRRAHHMAERPWPPLRHVAVAAGTCTVLRALAAAFRPVVVGRRHIRLGAPRRRRCVGRACRVGACIGGARVDRWRGRFRVAAARYPAVLFGSGSGGRSTSERRPKRTNSRSDRGWKAAGCAATTSSTARTRSPPRTVATARSSFPRIRSNVHSACESLGCRRTEGLRSSRPRTFCCSRSVAASTIHSSGWRSKQIVAPMKRSSR